MKELKFKKCMVCGTIVEVLEGNGNLICCGKTMTDLIPNSVDASFEKHVPTYEVEGNNIRAKVNHVMESETEKQVYKVNLKPGDAPELVAPYEKGSIIYAYCNKHGVWKKEVE